MDSRHSRSLGLGLALAFATLAGGAALPSAAAAAPAACDRACLRGALDQYMAAVFKHDPKAAPLAANLKATSNAAPLATGTGIWTTATGYGPVQRRFLDTANGAAVYFGHIQEGQIQDIVSVRIKVADHRITETEWTIARKADGNMFSTEGLVENMPPPDTALAVADRTPRAHMIAAADSYFQGLQDHNGSKIPHVNGCERIENGFKVTNRVRAAPPGAPARAAGAAPTIAEESRSGDCASGLEGFEKSIANVSPRRFTVVDEEAGVVLGEVILHRPPGVATKRNLLNEFFYTKGGKISAIYAAMYYLDPSAPDSPGW
jgi:hypothetical protein